MGIEDGSKPILVIKGNVGPVRIREAAMRVLDGKKEYTPEQREAAANISNTPEGQEFNLIDFALIARVIADTDTSTEA